MQSLLPKEFLAGRTKNSSTSEESPEAIGGATGMEDGKEGREEAGGKGNNSKAATVEWANVYIKTTQRRQAEMEAENEALRRRVEEMERRIREQSGGTTSGAASPGKGEGGGGNGDVENASPASGEES